MVVHEELQDVDSQKGPKSKRMKKRVLSQVVTPSNPTYLYDLVLKEDDVIFQDSKPFMGE